MSCQTFLCLVILFGFGVSTLTSLPALSSLPSLNQLLIASLRGLSGGHPPSTFSDFSGPVIQAISLSSIPTPAPTGVPSKKVTAAPGIGSLTGRARVTLDDIILTLSAYNFMMTAVKLESLIRTRPSLSNVLLSFSSEADAVLDNFFDELSKSEETYRIILDVRMLKNLNKLTGAMDNRVVSIAVLIQVSQIFNQQFMQVLRKENISLFAKISSLLPDIENLLINIAGVIDNLSFSSSSSFNQQEIDLIKNVEKNENKDEIRYPRYGEVIGHVNPVVNQVAAGQAFLHQLPLTFSSSSLLSSNSAKINSLFTILNSI